MKSRLHARKKKTREQTPDTTAQAKPMFQSRPFVVQSQSAKKSQPPDLKTSLKQAELYGHHVSQMQPTGVSAPQAVAVQQKKTEARNEGECIQRAESGKSDDQESEQSVDEESEQPVAESSKQREEREKRLRERRYEMQSELAPRIVENKQHSIAPAAVIDKGHGEKAIDSYQQRNFKDPKKFEGDYREKAYKYVLGQGGSGLDERVSTANVRDIVESEHKRQTSPEQIRKIVGKLSVERTPTGQAMWEYPGNNDNRLQGHPGALGKIRGDMGASPAKGHPHRDQRRSNMVMNEYNKREGHSNEEETRRVRAQGNAMSAAEMMSPYNSLSAIDPKRQKLELYHAKHGDMVEKQADGTNQWSKGYYNAASEAHHTRERIKIKTANELMEMGYGNLVQDGMRQLVGSHATPEEAINSNEMRNEPGVFDRGPARTQTNMPEAKGKNNPTSGKTIKEMSEENETIANSPAVPKRELYRMVSDPRGINRGVLKVRGEKKKPTVYEQKKITDYYKKSDET